MNQMADAERTKMIGESDRYEKQTGFVVFWYVWFLYLWQIWLCFSFFYKDVLSQALSEDAAWDFLIIFKDDFYSIFTILIFYNNFSFH